VSRAGRVVGNALSGLSPWCLVVSICAIRPETIVTGVLSQQDVDLSAAASFSIMVLDVLPLPVLFLLALGVACSVAGPLIWPKSARVIWHFVYWSGFALLVSMLVGLYVILASLRGMLVVIG
jgi:hypothetical protein